MEAGFVQTNADLGITVLLTLRTVVARLTLATVRGGGRVICPSCTVPALAAISCRHNKQYLSLKPGNICVAVWYNRRKDKF